MEINKENIGRLLKEGKDEAFVYVYRNYYPFMVNHSVAIVRDLDAAKDVAQSTIMNLWKRRDLIKTDHIIYAYLVKAVKNNSLNYLRSSKKLVEREASYERSKDLPKSPDYFAKTELLAQINDVLDNEPEERAKIFRMRKFEGYSTKEVSEMLNVNEKKIHYNISVVMEKMQDKLKSYLPVICVLMLNFIANYWDKIDFTV